MWYINYTRWRYTVRVTCILKVEAYLRHGHQCQPLPGRSATHPHTTRPQSPLSWRRMPRKKGPSTSGKNPINTPFFSKWWCTSWNKMAYYSTLKVIYDILTNSTYYNKCLGLSSLLNISAFHVWYSAYLMCSQLLTLCWYRFFPVLLSRWEELYNNIVLNCQVWSSS